ERALQFVWAARTPSSRNSRWEQLRRSATLVDGNLLAAVWRIKALCICMLPDSCFLLRLAHYSFHSPAVRIAAAFRPYVGRCRRIAPAHEGPRSESSNNAHEPTSGRSTHYGSGHLIRVFRDIEHIFSSQSRSCGFDS